MTYAWVSEYRALLGAMVLAVFVGSGAGVAFAAPDALPPVNIAFVGDSMADGLWGALFRRLGKDKCMAEKVKLIRRGRNGTGLTRLDQYNWIEAITALADNPGADLFVGSFGINDRQPIVEEDKTRVDFPSAAYDARYQEVAAEVVRRGIAKGASMLVMGLPVMLDPDANADASAKNRLFAAAVAAVGSPRAAYVPPWTSQPGAADEYKPYLPNARNAMVLVRAPDGVHFTTVGYDMVMDTFYPAILASLKQRGRDLEDECAKQVVR